MQESPRPEVPGQETEIVRTAHDISAETQHQPELEGARRADAIAGITEDYLASDIITGADGADSSPVTNVLCRPNGSAR